MPLLELQNPSQFILNSVIITADRFNTSVDITNSVIEYNVFESLESFFLTGSLIFLDDNNIGSSLNFSGTERITITVSLPVDGSQPITKTFIVAAVKDQVRTNDSSAVLQLLLIEEFGYLAQVKKYSKVYNGTVEQILTKICKDQLGKELVLVGEKTVQQPFRVLVPFMTVEESLMWVLNKGSTSTGTPYFLFSSFLSDTIFLVSLETILKEPSLNPNFPYVYSAAYTNKEVISVLNQGRAIETLKFNYQDDTLNFAKKGYFGSDYSITALDNNNTKTYHHNILDVYKKLNTEDILEASQTKEIVDGFFKLNDELLQNYNGSNFHQLSFSTYEDTKNYYEEQDFSITKNRLTNKALLNLLHKETIEINVPGLTFLINDKDVGAGKNISVSILNDSIDQESGEIILDKKHSGAYMIFNKRHLFSKRGNAPRHTVSLKLCRLTQEKR